MLNKYYCNIYLWFNIEYIILMQVNKVGKHEIHFKEKFSHILNNQSIFDALVRFEAHNAQNFSSINKLRINGMSFIYQLKTMFLSNWNNIFYFIIKNIAMTAGTFRRAHNLSQNKNNEQLLSPHENAFDLIDTSKTSKSISLDLKRKYKAWIDDKAKMYILIITI